jgi:hypothetical protein
MDYLIIRGNVFDVPFALIWSILVVGVVDIVVDVVYVYTHV